MLFAEASINWSNFLGPFHVVMLHFPIGFMAAAVLLELWAIRRPSAAAHQAVHLMLTLTVLISWMVSGLGYLRAARGEYDPKVVYWHTVFGLAFASLVTVAWIIHRRWYPHPERSGLRKGYLGLMTVSVGLLTVTAHAGGTLTHGAKFLTEGAPPMIGELLAEMDPAVDAGPKPGTDDGGEWRDHVRPVLEKKCFSCHGAEKQKGKLRLDQRDTALRGGESGKASIVPGAPLQSRLVELVLLPPSHDDAMPPAGKESLSPEEIVLLVRWIQSGASYGTAAQ